MLMKKKKKKSKQILKLLKDIEPKEIKVFDVLKMINDALIKGMVLLEMNISAIEDIIENDQFNEEYSEKFLSNIGTFTR